MACQAIPAVAPVTEGISSNAAKSSTARMYLTRPKLSVHFIVLLDIMLTFPGVECIQSSVIA
ncbi:hypothetical protein PSDVSF_00500 [Pseudodesulfovibrio sediminis]|uniref:Uncharacterized protein n=1 Tax=Pseudodesulfovibrio sediminis TaxID=2810563 RepID=A0ABN6ENZ7_9BACT|nr:hypothetical protein PSDVSF_00500 [Pseudodesulfovibrio sediminis]